MIYHLLHGNVISLASVISNDGIAAWLALNFVGKDVDDYSSKCQTIERMT